jgi:LPXTG-motif cell wall-anchored protein
LDSSTTVTGIHVNLDRSRAIVEGHAQNGDPVRAEIALGDGDAGMLRGGAQVGVKFSDGTLSGKIAPTIDSPNPVGRESGWLLGLVGVPALIVAGLLLLRFRRRRKAVSTEPGAPADRPGD